MYLQKISRKNFVKNQFFAGMLKVNDENGRLWIQDPDPVPDPLVRSMDPRIRIRIHPKMSWIRNTAGKSYFHRLAACSPVEDALGEDLPGLGVDLEEVLALVPHAVHDVVVHLVVRERPVLVNGVHPVGQRDEAVSTFVIL